MRPAVIWGLAFAISVVANAAAQNRASAATMTEEWLKQQPVVPIVQLTAEDTALLDVLLSDWRGLAARSGVPLTIARDLNQVDRSIEAAVDRAFTGKVPENTLTEILSDLTRRNTGIQTLDTKWNVRDAVVVAHRVQMMFEYGAHAPDANAERLLLHFKSFSLPGYDATRSRAIFVFSRSWEIENPFRGLVAVYFEKKGSSWRAVARHELSEHGSVQFR